MQIQLRRMTGKVLDARDWTPPKPVWAQEMRDLIKLRLMSFYGTDNNRFWPLEIHRDRTPEEVRVIDDAGNIIDKYDLRGTIKETGLTLVGAEPRKD